MSILTMVQDAALETKQNIPTTVVGSSNKTATLFAGLARREAKVIRAKILWPQLIREYTFTLSDGVASYALPGDLDYQVHQTHWDRANQWGLIGPRSPQDWQQRISGITTVSPRFEYRVKGIESEQFFITPTPGSGDDGNTLVFEYSSTSWIRPKTWAATTSYSLNEWVSYDGRYYKCTTAGTSSSTAPTHTSGTVADGTVSWLYSSDTYDRFVADEDVSLLDEDCMTMAMIWRWRELNGLPFERLKQETDRAWERQISKYNPPSSISMGSLGADARLIDISSIPDTGYGS